MATHVSVFSWSLECCDRWYDANIRCYAPYAPLCHGDARVPEDRVFYSKCPPLRSARRAALDRLARLALQAVCTGDDGLLHHGLAGVRGRAADDRSGCAGNYSPGFGKRTAVDRADDSGD